MEREDKLHFATYEEAANWFDTHDMADYEEDLIPVEFHFDGRKDRNWVELEHDLAKKLYRLAQETGTTTRALVNNWLRKIMNSDLNIRN